MQKYVLIAFLTFRCSFQEQKMKFKKKEQNEEYKYLFPGVSLLNTHCQTETKVIFKAESSMLSVTGKAET